VRKEEEKPPGYREPPKTKIGQFLNLAAPPMFQAFLDINITEQV
jgi:hypothetical protein